MWWGSRNVFFKDGGKIFDQPARYQLTIIVVCIPQINDGCLIDVLF